MSKRTEFLEEAREKLSRVELEKLAVKVEQGEAILAQLSQVSGASLQREKADQQLAQTYLILNQLVEAARIKFGYPKDREQWQDTRPISLVGELVIGIQESQWWQKQLESVITFF